ncbi:uncharacterized protein LOC117182611 [Belonocnema kinseyi]|uniref:uncharacterized protein LOC117182611 n=1 Tax=Belonocnema kinseyi TaxID=2817044 RepID=UPI00143D49C3|nr:uncharacterized protein LOC117182611 [Belonocnema kinseyi]
MQGRKLTKPPEKAYGEVELRQEKDTMKSNIQNLDLNKDFSKRKYKIKIDEQHYDGQVIRVAEMFKWWLQKYRKYSEAEADKEAEKTRFYIGPKIASLKRIQSEDRGENNLSENAQSPLEDIREHGQLGDVQGDGPSEDFESNGALEDFQGNEPFQNEGNDPLEDLQEIGSIETRSEDEESPLDDVQDDGLLNTEN